MAKLGVKTLDELVGRTDFLEQRDVPESGRSSKVDLSRILNNPFAKDTGKIHYNKKDVYNFQLEKTIDEKILIKKLEKAMDCFGIVLGMISKVYEVIVFSFCFTLCGDLCNVLLFFIEILFFFPL